MTLEWDDAKAAANVAKHGVSFEEAATVFDDPLFVEFFDPDHAEGEDRYLIVGLSGQGRLLIVAYAERADAVRLISARTVTRKEKEAYEGR
ncbi:MAG: BrnT family toxin [Ardenticatenales bacterium]|nr:BrnT family toxin [Ardenticatenales bacterium]